MDARTTLQSLRRIQQLALSTREAQQTVDAAPARVEEIEARFRERNAEYVALEERYTALDEDQRRRSTELVDLEQKRDKYQADLMEVKNQREYAAMLKEIDVVKAEISGNEEAVLQAMETLERLQEELANFKDHIAQEREAVAVERGQVESEAQAARETIERLAAERASIEAELPGPLVNTVALIESRRQGVFLSEANHGTCQSCFVRVRPQKFQEVKLATAVHTCDNCRRFLYFEASLQESGESPAGGGASASDSGGANVEALNGGAV